MADQVLSPETGRELWNQTSANMRERLPMDVRVGLQILAWQIVMACLAWRYAPANDEKIGRAHV